MTKVLVALLLVASIACSSTSEKSRGEAAGDATEDTIAAVEDSAERANADASGATGSKGASTGAAPRGEGASAAPGAGTSGPAVAAPKKISGVLKLGVHLSANAAAASAFGIKLPAHSPAKVDAILKWINATGGIGGRRVVPVYHTTDPLEGSFDQQAQEACTDLTQDHKVDLAISAAQLYRDSLPACFAKNRTPLLWNVFFITKRSVVPVEYLYRPAQAHAERLGFVVDGLHRHGFFKGARLGLIRYDSAKHKDIADTVFKPALASHGLKVHSEIALREPDSASQASDTAAASSSAALRLRQQGVTHVLFVPSGGAIPLLFLAAAESQNYRPKYGLSSQDAPYFVRDSVPKAQLAGAAGVGWAPAVDLGPRSTSAQQFSAGSRRCVDLARKAGFRPDEAPMSYCDMLFFLRAALASGAAPTVEGLRAGTERLTAGYESALQFGAKFAAGRHDGTSVARTFVWDGDWKYVGPRYNVR